MRGLLLRFIINAIAVAVITSGILPGIRIEGEKLPTLIVVAVVLGFLNALVKPVLTLLTCPVVLLTLGLFLLVINGLMLYGAAAITNWLATTLTPAPLGRLMIDNFLWAVVGAVMVSIVGIVLERFITVDDHGHTRRAVEARYVMMQERRKADRAFEEFVRGEDDLPFDDPPRR